MNEMNERERFSCSWAGSAAWWGCSWAREASSSRPWASVNLSAGAVGIALGVLGYFRGARRLGAASVVLGTAAIFFIAAAGTGLIPVIEPLDHGYD